MKDCTSIAIDTAKNTFYVVGFDQAGRVVGRRKFSRPGLKTWIAKQQMLIIYIEACAGSHEWGRFFMALDHEVRLIAPQFVTPFRQGEKNDWNDAKAIGIAGHQPTMRFVGIKTPEQQSVQALHRVRSRVQRDRVSLANQLRGLLVEFGITAPRAISHLKRKAAAIVDEDRLPQLMSELVRELLSELSVLDKRVKNYDLKIQHLARLDPVASQLMTMPGIGPVTASALVSGIADVHVFRNGRQLSAYLGLVPRQFSTGGQSRLGSITKRGDRYLRQLLIHGARSVIRCLGNKKDRISCWLRQLIERRGINKAVVALANKQARWVWAKMVALQV